MQAGPQRCVRIVRGRYDAAVTTETNFRHWVNADGLCINAAAAPGIRRILRNRSRYEVFNNSYARGIVSTLANDMVGTGPRLQMLTGDAEANGQIEQPFQVGRRRAAGREAANHAAGPGPRRRGFWPFGQ